MNVLSGDGLWGQTTFETERMLKEVHGKDVGVLVIGPGGENACIVKYATITSQEGRAGGRPGWDERGIPKKGTIEKLKLSDVATELEKICHAKPAIFYGKAEVNRAYSRADRRLREEHKAGWAGKVRTYIKAPEGIISGECD